MRHCSKLCLGKAALSYGHPTTSTPYIPHVAEHGSPHAGQSEKLGAPGVPSGCLSFQDSCTRSLRSHVHHELRHTLREVAWVLDSVATEEGSSLVDHHDHVFCLLAFWRTFLHQLE